MIVGAAPIDAGTGFKQSSGVVMPSERLDRSGRCRTREATEEEREALTDSLGTAPRRRRERANGSVASCERSGRRCLRDETRRPKWTAARKQTNKASHVILPFRMGIRAGTVPGEQQAGDSGQCRIKYSLNLHAKKARI
jgi:hypothetical protein